MEYYISELIDYLTTFLLIIFGITVGFFMYRGSQINGFHQQTAQVVQRSGGLTNKNRSYLDTISKKYYHNLYTAEPLSRKEPIAHYGQSYGYRIVATHGGIPYNVFGDTFKSRRYNYNKVFHTESQVRNVNGQSTNTDD